MKSCLQNRTESMRSFGMHRQSIIQNEAKWNLVLQMRFFLEM